MVKVKVKDQEYYMDGILKDNLDTIKKVIRKDWDFVYTVDGVEGTGKSVFAQQVAYYCTDGKFELKDIAFTPKEFMEKVTHAKPYHAVIFDEALSGFMGRSSIGFVNKMLVQMMAEIRQKNLFIFIVLPSFFDLDRNIALWRSRGVFHVYTTENLERGRFAFWNQSKKKALWVEGKKYYSYKKPMASFKGRFLKHYVVDEAEYRAMKLKSLKGSLKGKKLGIRGQNQKGQRDSIIKYLLDNEIMTARELSAIFRVAGYPMAESRISQILKGRRANT